MAGRRDDSLIAQIERDALDDSVPIATALRKGVVLGGKSGSEELRDWATRELKGYGPDDELPDYRVIAAPLLVDAIKGNYQVTRQPFPPMSLPDFARKHIKEEVRLNDGLGSIEALLEQAEIKLMPPMGTDLVNYMNQTSGVPYQHIVAIYWGVSHAAVKGLLDQIRTALTQLVAELRASMVSGEELPSREAADQAVSVVVSGKRSRVTVTTTQASGAGSTATTGLALRERGWRIDYLGADTPVDSLEDTARRTDPSVVVLSAVRPEPLEQLAALATRHRVAIAGAGAASARVQGVERLTTDPVTAAERLPT